MKTKISDCLQSLDELVKHLNEINRFTKVNHDPELRMLAQRNTPYQMEEEQGRFPAVYLPVARNDLFYGRSDEMKRINNHLDRRTRDTLRTYTIYGRRGVGKTQIALEYAYRNEPGFDAIFWVRCETASSLRESFSEIALRLGLSRADTPGHFFENFVAVQRWLKRTSKCILYGSFVLFQYELPRLIPFDSLHVLVSLYIRRRP